MPTYGYRCTVCETTFERFQKITDPPITECIECGSAVKKILYPVGIQFKGSGFYVNDYAAKGSDSGSSSKSSSASTSNSESTTETKTETKTEAAPAPATTPTTPTTSAS